MINNISVILNQLPSDVIINKIILIASLINLEELKNAYEIYIEKLSSKFFTINYIHKLSKFNF
jgi:hypothetical protein